MGSIGDAPKGKGKRPKNKPTLTDANKPVIDALRDNLQGNKIWICKDDTLEVNRKPLEGFVCTPGEGVTAEEHTNVLLSAINNMLSNMEQAETVVEAVMEFDEFEQEGEVHFIYPNLSDRNMWRNVVNYRMPNNFIRRLAEQYSIEQNIAVRWVLEYLKYMYIKSLHPNSVPSENIGKVCRLHTQYTKSYGDLCGILENRIHYEPIDVQIITQHTEYNRTLNRYYSEFGFAPDMISWNGCESLDVEKSVNPKRFWIIKKFWKR